MAMSIVRALATPEGTDTRVLSSAVATKLAERTRKQVAQGRRVESSSALRALEQMDFSGMAWRPELGMAAALCRVNPELAVLQLAMIASCDGPLSVTIEKAGRLYLDGETWIVRGICTLEKLDGQLLLGVGGETIPLEHDKALWRPRNRSERRGGAIPLASHGPRYLLSFADVGVAGTFPDPRTARNRAGDAPLERFNDEKQVIDALDEMQTFSPGHLQWVSSVVDAILCVPRLSGGISTPSFPGLVAVAGGLSTHEAMELLVCAAAQQNLYQLALLGTLTDGTEEVHYIPSRRSYATTRKTLGAAHEHVAALSLLRRLAAHGCRGVDVDRRLAMRKLMFEAECFQALERSRVLTEQGRELWSLLKASASGDATPNESAESQIPVAGLATNKEK